MTAKTFVEAGASVVLADWNEKSVQAVARELAEARYKTLALKCDVSDDRQVEEMVRATVSTFGRLDAAYNNAGVQNELANAADQRREDFDRVTGINYRGVWSCMKYELQQMEKQGSWAIVNCSSIGGILYVRANDRRRSKRSARCHAETNTGRPSWSPKGNCQRCTLALQRWRMVVGHTLVVEGG